MSDDGDSQTNQYPVDPLLTQAVQQQESGGDPNAVSSKGAVGTMQTLPSTLKNPGYGVTPAKDDSAAEKQRVGEDYLQAMHNKYQDSNLALMAYNWGPTNVDNWIADGQNPAAVPAETKDYVQNVNAIHQQLQAKQLPTGTQVASNDDSAYGMADNGHQPLKIDVPNINGGSSIEDDLKAELASRKASAPKAETPSNSSIEDDLKAELASRVANPQPAVQAQSQNQEPKQTGIMRIPQWIGEQETQQNAKNALTTIGKQWPESMTPTDIAMIVPEVAGGVGAQSVATGLGNALTRASPEIAQAVAGSKALQLGGAGLAGAANVAGYNAVAGNNLTSGMGTGAALNAAVPALSMVGKPIASEVANLAQTASDKYGIKIPAGLLSDNPLVNKAYSLLDRMSMTPANNNSENFAKGVSQTFGSNATKLTRGAMDDAGDNIGNMFQDVKAAVPDAQISNNVLTKLANIDSSAKNVIADSDTRIAKQINNIQDIAAKNNGKIPNSAWQTLTDSNSDLSTLAKESGAVGEKARDIKDALYEALGENAPPAVLDKFNQAKQYYKNYKTVKNGEGTLYDPLTGDVNPTGLAAKVRQTAKKYGDNGLNDLQNLGDIGQQFKLSPSSGTAENQLIAKAGQHIGKEILGTVGASGYAAGNLPGALTALGATYAGGKLAGKALSSDLYRNMLLSNSLGTAAPNINPALISLGAKGINNLTGQ